MHDGDASPGAGPDGGLDGGEPFRHEALLYPDAATYASVIARFVRAGLARDEPTLVVVPGSNLARVRAALGGDAAAVRFEDMTEVGANSNRLIPWVVRPFLAQRLDRTVRIVSEPVWPRRAPEEITLAIQHEALTNRAFAGCAATLLCPYDSTRLSASVLAFAARTHPLVRDGDEVRPCAGFVDPDVVVASLNNPLPPPGRIAAQLAFGRHNLTELRNVVARYASRAGMEQDRIGDLRLAVNEVATNTIVHGRSGGTVRVWYEEDRLICEIQGPGEIDDPLAGRRVPPERSPRGRGLLVANNVCDLVETYTSADATTTRLHMRY